MRVAYIFLSEGDLSHQEIWNTYFQSEELESILVFMHRTDNVQLCTLQSRQVHLVPTIPSSLGAFSLMEARQTMIRQALGLGATHFLFLSGDSLPLHETIKQTLEHIPRVHSLFHFHEDGRHDRASHIKKHHLPAGKQLQWRRHSPWCILIRKHVQMLEDHWSDIRKMFELSSVPEEHVYGTMLTMLEEQPWIMASPSYMYVDTRKSSVSCAQKHTGAHPYHAPELNIALLHKIRAQESLFLSATCSSVDIGTWKRFLALIETSTSTVAPIPYFQHITCSTCPTSCSLSAKAIVFITLQSRPDRTVHIQQELHRLGLCNHTIGYFAIKQSKQQPDGYGCWHSHRAVALYCQENNLCPAIVLEDDAIFFPIFTPQNIMCKLNMYTDICVRDNLGLLAIGYLPVLLFPTSFHEGIAVGVGYNNHSYIMNTSFMTWIIHHPVSMHNKHLDQVTSQNIVRTRYAFPMLTTQRTGTSDNLPLDVHAKNQNVSRCEVMYPLHYVVMSVSFVVGLSIAITLVMLLFARSRRYAYLPLLCTFLLYILIYVILLCQEQK
jgi:hypothetical protein